MFYDLVRPHEHRLRKVALAVVRNEADAEDVVQETLLKAFRNLGGFRADARLSTWLISITVNEAKGHLRRRGLLAFEPLETHNDRLWTGREDQAISPYEAAERRQLLDVILRALSGLHPRYRNIYFLREIHELSTEKAAERLGITIPVAKTRLHRARHLLRERLNGLTRPPLKRKKKPDAADAVYNRPDTHAATSSRTRHANRSQDRPDDAGISVDGQKPNPVSEANQQSSTRFDISPQPIGSLVFQELASYSREVAHV